MKKAHADSLADALLDAMEKPLAALLRRIEALEARPQLVDAGTYQEGKTYQAGNIVSHAGSGWIANRTTDTKPPSDGWRLLVKRGRDGRDAR